jgi:septum site-determining protein MinD
MSRKIVITSGKGGVGKTSFSLNIGAQLAKLGRKVVLLDLDLGLNNLDVVSGIENQIIYDIVDVVSGKCRLKQALVKTSIHPLLYVLPSCQSYGRHLVTVEKLQEITSLLEVEFDFILLDSPAGVDEGFFKAAKVANEAIILTTPHISAIRDAAKVLTILKGLEIPETNFVVNRVRGDMLKNEETVSINAIESFIKCPLLAVIPESDQISFSGNIGSSAKGGEVEKALKLAAQNIDTGSRIIYDAKKPYTGLWGAFKKRRTGS